MKKIIISNEEFNELYPLAKRCKCNANTPMEGIWCWDDDQVTDTCFNVKACDACGSIVKIHACDNDKETWIYRTI